jgi:UDP-N-acetylglucosamine 2-epimerase (non-hydrolysing)
MKRKYLFIFGTRPEAIKMAPLILEALTYTNSINVEVCITGQHKEMLDQVISFFNIPIHYNLNLMKQNQTLFDVTIDGLNGIKSVLEMSNPDIVFVQGDTTTAMVGSLAAFYKKIKIVHIEAGLRSQNKFSPYPEEANRKIVSTLADFHMVPTKESEINLLKENIKENIFITGNTVIDALLDGVEKIKDNEKISTFFNFIDKDKRIILVTGHRRESFGTAFDDICISLKNIAETNKDVEIIYPVHLNPNVQEPVKRILSDIKNIHLMFPLEYPYLIWLLHKSYFVLTDSGGIQEEAPSLGKPVIVMREVTERQEGVDAGNAVLVGTDKNKIIEWANILLSDDEVYHKMATVKNPYGDGTASKKIISILNNYFND